MGCVPSFSKNNSAVSSLSDDIRYRVKQGTLSQILNLSL